MGYGESHYTAAFTNITGNFTPLGNSPLITTGTASQTATDRTGVARPNSQGYVTAGAVQVSQNATSSGGSGGSGGIIWID